MVKEKNFTVVKYAVKNKEIIDYFTKVGLLSNNLTNVNIYHHRQWFFYTQNLYYQENPKENFKPYKYDIELIDNLKDYMNTYNAKQILKGKNHISNKYTNLTITIAGYQHKQLNK